MSEFNIVHLPMMKWHQMCAQLGFVTQSAQSEDSMVIRKRFGDYFNCRPTWKSFIDEWDGRYETRRDPCMELTFNTEEDAVLFALKWL